MVFHILYLSVVFIEIHIKVDVILQVMLKLTLIILYRFANHVMHYKLLYEEAKSTSNQIKQGNYDLSNSLDK